MRVRQYQLPHGVAPDCERIEQLMHGELGVAGGGRATVRFVVGVAGDQRPTGVVEVHVEAGQHQRAVRQFRDGGEQLGGRRHRAGGTGGDHGRVAAGKAFRFGLDQFVAALGGFDGAALVAQGRPGVARDLEEVERELPIGIEIARHQAVELAPRHLACGHVVHQAGEVVGKTERGGRRIGDQRRTGGAAHGRRIRPFQD